MSFLSPDPTTVVLLDVPIGPAALHAALTEVVAAPTAWRVLRAADLAAGDPVDLVVSAGPLAAGRFDGAAVLVVVSSTDDGTGVVRALESGAMCARGYEPAVIAAYLGSLARRRAADGADADSRIVEVRA